NIMSDVIPLYRRIIPGTFWFVRFDGFGKIVDDEEKNADIAVATASIFDEVSGDFSAQKPVKLNRLGYKCDSTVRDIKLLPMSQIFLSIVVFVVDTGSTLHF